MSAECLQNSQYCYHVLSLRAVDMVGVEIGSHINDWNLDAEELYPVWQVSEKRLYQLKFRATDKLMSGGNF